MMAFSRWYILLRNSGLRSLTTVRMRNILPPSLSTNTRSTSLTSDSSSQAKSCGRAVYTPGRDCTKSCESLLTLPFALLAGVNQLGFGRHQPDQFRTHQVVVNHDVGAAQNVSAANRDQIGGAGTRTY